MKQYLFIIAIALLGSCAKNAPDGSDIPGGSVSSVRFMTEVATRGTSITRDNIQEFGVFCYDLSGTTWDPAASIPNKMNDLKVTRRLSGSSDWTYGDPIEWNGGDGRRFTFLGYSPHATGKYMAPDQTHGNNIEVLTPIAGVPTLSYETLNYVPGQIDLLLAAPVLSITSQKNVFMNFSHALTQIRFKAWSIKPGVIPSSIAINGVKYKGTVGVDGKNIAWTTENETENFSIEGNFPPVSTDENNMTDLTAGGNAFMLIPQDMTANATATIVIKAMIAGVEKSTEYIIKENWLAGKSFTYNIDLGGDPTEEIVITGVTVSEWGVDSEENMDTNPPAVYATNPPTANQYVTIDGLSWTKGNLIAVNKHQCKVGNPGDGGVYFQFGSLIGSKGGDVANGGKGVGMPASTANGKFWDGATAYSWENDAMVWPVNMLDNPTTWPSESTNKWYFGLTSWGSGNNFRDYPDLVSGGLSAVGVGDPCTYYLGDPWRLPTNAEWVLLCNGIGNTDNSFFTWASVGGKLVETPVKGGSFSSDRIFIPIAGSKSDGSFKDVLSRGLTLSSITKDNLHNYSLSFNSWSGVAPYGIYQRSYASPARCVSGTYIPTPTESYIPVAILTAAGWPVDKLPATGLQVAVRGENLLPGNPPAVGDKQAQWKTSNTWTTGTLKALGTGKNNTALMAGAEHPAAQYCRDMGTGWYLPSEDELMLIYTNSTLLGVDYTFITQSYWSSTETEGNNQGAQSFHFGMGITTNGAKTSEKSVRCVREF